jgi:hypothetical protein
MKTQIDIKSVLCGVAIGVLAVFAIGAGTSSNQVGKYQVTSTGNGTGGWLSIMVDTQTGESWGVDFSRNAVQKPDKFWDAK